MDIAGVPFLVIVVGALGVAVWAFTCARTAPGWPARILLALVGTAALAPAGLAVVAAYPELVDARVRAYKAFYAEIETGMTREQVWATMERVYPADGPRTRPNVLEDSASRLSFFMADEGRDGPNCEGIFLDLRDGVVTRRDYARD